VSSEEGLQDALDTAVDNALAYECGIPGFVYGFNPFAGLDLTTGSLVVGPTGLLARIAQEFAATSKQYLARIHRAKAQRWKQSRIGEPKHYLDLADLFNVMKIKRNYRLVRDYFHPSDLPSAGNAFSESWRLVDLRNRTAHPVRHEAQPILPEGTRVAEGSSSSNGGDRPSSRAREGLIIIPPMRTHHTS